jgi:hypothetical protein
MMFPLTQYQENINACNHAMGADVVFLQFVQQYPATLHCLGFNDEAHFHHDGFVYKQNMRFWDSENPQRVMEMSLHSAKCTM